jgi:hypothetical protein
LDGTWRGVHVGGCKCWVFIEGFKCLVFVKSASSLRVCCSGCGGDGRVHARAGRTLVAILDNYGSVKIPTVLQKYMDGRCVHANAMAAICHTYRFRG